MYAFFIVLYIILYNTGVLNLLCLYIIFLHFYNYIYNICMYYM